MGNTFGWEAEYATPVTTLALELHRRDLTIDSSVHGYTCECSGCVHVNNEDDEDCYGNSYDHDPFAFRVKHDSSCGGEVISRVFDNTTEAKTYWDILEEASVQTDSEPGLQAGFHVHVGRSHLLPAGRGRLVWMMMLFEDVLLQIASGRFTSHRGWNSRLEEVMSPFMCDWIYENKGVTIYDTEEQRSNVMELISTSEDFARTFYRALGAAHRSVDRHTSMAFSPRFPTMEFRLWNSTRASWRMELWCRLSLLLAEPAFTKHALDNYAPHMSVGAFVDIVKSYCNVSRETSVLLERQQNFILEASEFTSSYNRTFTSP